MGTPLAATVESYTHGPFSLQTDGGRITLTRGGEVLVARDGTGKIPGPPADARWTVERGTGALTATLAYPRVIKRVILRERDAFIAFRLTTPPDQDIDKRSGVLYLLEVPKEAFAGGRLYAADVSNAKCGWRPGDAQLKIKDPKVIGVARDGERFEVQISTTMRRLWRAEARIPPEPTGTCQLRALFTIPRNQSAWMVFRFTTDPETPLPPDPDDPLHPETGNLFRDLASVADAGYAIALRRSLRAVFRGQTVRIDGLYVDRDAAERDVGYTWRVRDWRDRTVSEGRGRFASAGRGHLVQDIAEIACDRTGAFKLDLEATDGTTTLTRQTTFAVLPRPRWHGRRHDGFHGGHVGISTNDPWRLHLARMSGVTWTRLHDSSGIHEVYWRDLEPEEGRFVLEEPVILKAFKRANMNVDACLRNGCPAWVTERIMARLRSEHPDLSDEQLNKKLGSWYHHADAIALYKRFLRVMLEDRGHLIDALEPQNEIYYARNIQGQVNLTRATREVIDEVAPHIKLVGMNAPPASYGSDWAEWCRREGVGRVSDVIGAHFYVSRGIAALGSEKAMESWCLGLRRLFAAEDGGRPVWNTEWCTNFPTLFQDHPHHEANVYHPGDAALRLDSHMYAVVNVRQFIAMAVHGIKSFWHVYYTGSAMDRRLHEYDWTPNPAGVAFSAATAILDGAVFHDHWQACPDLRGYVVDTPRGAVAVTFGTRFLDEETASLVFPRTVAGASALDTMANAIGPLTAGTTLTIDNDPVYIVAPSMDAPALLAHLSEAVVTPPARGSIIAKFLFDGAEPGEADGIADEAGLYQLKRAGPGNAATSRGPLLLRDRVDRGPAAATFDYGDNLCLHGPPDCGAMFAMRARHRFAHVFDATDQAGMALTVEAWVKLGSPPKGRQWVSSVIFEKNRWRHAPQYRLYIDREGRARWTHSWGTGDETYVRLTGPVLPVGKWTHVAGTTEYDGTTMRCRLYVDRAARSRRPSRPCPSAAAGTTRPPPPFSRTSPWTRSSSTAGPCRPRNSAGSRARAARRAPSRRAWSRRRRSTGQASCQSTSRMQPIADCVTRSRGTRRAVLSIRGPTTCANSRRATG